MIDVQADTARPQLMEGCSLTLGSADAPPKVTHNIAASQLHTPDISAQGDDSNSRGAAMSCLTAGVAPAEPEE